MLPQTHRLPPGAPTINPQEKNRGKDRAKDRDPDKSPAGADFAAGNSLAEPPVVQARPGPAKMARQSREAPLPQALRVAEDKVSPGAVAVSSRCSSTIKRAISAKGSKPDSRRKAERPTIWALSDKLPRLMPS
jgi:hypothetical protein